MPENYHLAAIEECKREFNVAMGQLGTTLQTKITAPPTVIDAFARKFEQDFSNALTDQKDKKSATFPKNAWAATRTQVLLKVHAIAALAVSYALEGKVNTLTEAHLRTAVLNVKPDCQTTTQPLKDAAAKSRSRRRRLEFCGGWGLAGFGVGGSASSW